MRKQLKKSIRFEVLKRDAFTCQYCGAKAPDVLLHIDHVMPVASGGSDEIYNLVTSCQPCNAGKKDKLLSDKSALSVAKNSAAAIQAEAEQMQMLIEWHKALKQHCPGEMVVSYWKEAARVAEGPWDKDKQKTRKLVESYGLREMLKAVDDAVDSYIHRKYPDPEKGWSKVAKIAKINHQAKTDPLLKPTLKLSGLAAWRFRCQHWTNRSERVKLQDFIRSKLESGVPECEIESSIHAAKNSYDFRCEGEPDGFSSNF